MGKEIIPPTERYITTNEGHFELMPGHPVFPPDYKPEGHEDPIPAFLDVSREQYTEIFIDVTDGNAPLQVHINSGGKEQAKDIIWIGEQKTIHIPYAEGTNDASIYFLRRLNKGICKGNFKLIKE